MKIKYLGHSCFLIDDLLIDPFIKGNDKIDIDVNSISCKIICVTHDHFDHLGDAYEIAKNTGATIVAIPEICWKLPEGLKGEGMNIGGEITVGDWTIKMVKAYHTCGVGSCVGFILKKDGKSIYHAGDTGLFGDMKYIGEEGIDIAMLPMGGRFTMGVDDALKAVKLLNPKQVIPMHYGTFPILISDPKDFKEKCSCDVNIFKLGEEKEL